jgi:ABC-type lipoprotein release transport system permease subunit
MLGAMGAVRYLARSQARRRWGTLLLVALVLGLVGGVATALVAGASRSSSVVDRFFAAATPYTVQLYAPAITQTQAAALPGVVRADGFSYLPFAVQPDGDIRGGSVNANAAPAAMLDGTYKLLDGRYPRPGSLDEAIVNRAYAKKFGVDVGDTVRMRAYEDLDAAGGNSTSTPPTGPTFPFHIVGIMRTPGEISLHEPRLVGDSVYESDEAIFVSIEFFDKHRSEVYDFGKGYLLILRDPNQRAAVEAAARKLNAADGGGDELSFSEPPLRPSRPSYETPVTFETGALLALGIAVALLGAITIVFILRADQRVQNRERATMYAIGATRSQLGSAAVLRVLPGAVAGVVIAWGIAYALSDRFPIGFGAQLELDEGRALNVAVFAIAALIVVTFTALCAFAFAFRSAREPAARRGALTAWLERVGAPRDAVLGTHFAFGHGDAKTTVPTRPAIVGGTLAVVLVVAAGIFANSVNDLYATPAHRGWTWDAVIGNPDVPFSDQETVDRLARDDRFRASTFASFGPIVLNQRLVDVLVIDQDGTAPPKVLEGRLPRAEREIVLGPKLRDALGAGIGDDVEMTVEGGGGEAAAEPQQTTMTVVGIGFAPAFSNAELGQQAIITESALGDNAPPLPTMLLAQVKGDPQTTVENLADSYHDQITVDMISSRVESLHDVRSLPLIGLTFAAVLGVALLAFTLAIGARARAREMGVLRALGVSARRLRRVLAWQGLIIAMIIVIVGVPLGVLAGNAAWQYVVNDMGLVVDTTFSWWIAVVALAVIALGLVCALVPARRARLANIAALLKVE